MMQQRKCKHCGKVFRSRDQNRAYCSRRCLYDGLYKGAGANYVALHYRVQRLRGRPQVCSACGTTSAKRYDWANMTGRYTDPQDYRRMCRSCHFIHDNALLENRILPAEIPAFGETKSVHEWARDDRCQANISAVCSRIYRGWDAERAISTPLVHPGRRTKHPHSEWAKKHNALIACGCGCGQMIPLYDSRGRCRAYARGHSAKVKRYAKLSTVSVT